MMEKPILSPNFTIEDIHKLREYNYYHSNGLEVHKIIQQRKLQKT